MSTQRTHAGIHTYRTKISEVWGLVQALKHWQLPQVQVYYIKTCTWEHGLALSLRESDTDIGESCILFLAGYWEYLNLLPKKYMAHTFAHENIDMCLYEIKLLLMGLV